MAVTGHCQAPLMLVSFMMPRSAVESTCGMPFSVVWSQSKNSPFSHHLQAVWLEVWLGMRLRVALGLGLQGDEGRM